MAGSTNLEGNLKAAQTPIGSLDQELRKTKKDLSEAIEKEAQQRQAGLKAVHESVEQQAVGDLAMQVAGLALLLLSIFLANAPAESAFVLKAIGVGSLPTGEAINV